MLIADGRTNTNLGRARHRGTRALHRECRIYTYLVVPITYRQSSRQAHHRKNVNAGSACARLSRFPVAWRFDFEVRTAVRGRFFGSERRRGAPLWFPSPRWFWPFGGWLVLLTDI